MSPAPLVLGTAALALPYGPAGNEEPPPPAAQAVATIRAAVALGLTMVDTAPAYGDAEAITGEALAPHPEVAVATKLAAPPGGWDAMPAGWVRRSIDASRAALGRDVLDLVSLHSAGEALLAGPVAEALEAERAAGRVRAIGATVYTPAEACAVRAPLTCVQVPASVLDRRALDAAPRELEVHARSVLLRGVLSRAALDLPPAFAALRDAADAVRDALGATWEQLPGAATAWVAAQPGVDAVLIGPRDTPELEDLVAGAAAFATRAAVRLPEPDVPAELLDPRTWPR